MTSGKKPPPPPEIFLSCGTLECPAHAKNLNLPFAEELAEHLNVELHAYPHGHQMEGWSPQLEKALPALGLELKASQSLDSQAETTEQLTETQSTDVTAKPSIDESLASRQTTQQYKAAIKEIKDDSAPSAGSAKEQQDDDDSSFNP